MIFFDIDDTLLDHKKAERQGAISFYEELQGRLDYSLEEFLEKWDETSAYYFNRYLNDDLSFQEQRRERMKSIFYSFVNTMSNQVADRLFDIYLSYYRSQWVAFDDVEPSLQKLKDNDFSLGIISNGSYDQQVSKLQAMGIASFFSTVVTSDHAGVSKPDPVIFYKACEQANCATDQCYYIGDRLETDALGSQLAGLHGVWLNRNSEKKAVVSSISTASSLHEVVEHFLKAYEFQS